MFNVLCMETVPETGFQAKKEYQVCSVDRTQSFTLFLIFDGADWYWVECGKFVPVLPYNI